MKNLIYSLKSDECSDEVESQLETITEEFKHLAAYSIPTASTQNCYELVFEGESLQEKLSKDIELCRAQVSKIPKSFDVEVKFDEEEEICTGTEL